MIGPRERPEAQQPAWLAAALAREVLRLATARGAEADAARVAGGAARTLSLAAGEGQVCLPLEVLADRLTLDPSAMREALVASRVVGCESAPAQHPLVLDDGARLYLHRAFDHECALARRLRRAFDAPPARAGAEDPTGDEQAAAVEAALRQRLTLISGGPGTGKTSTVVQLLARVFERDGEARVAIAAPTGKAAARLAASIVERAAALLPQRLAALAAHLPLPTQTVHRLLGHRPQAAAGEAWRHHAGRPLALDWLVVDEASMLDLALARRLFDAVPETAHIVLLGDAHQLAAVEAGAVFAEIAALPRDGTTQRLTRAWRFGAASAIARLAAAVNRGDVAAAIATIESAGGPGRLVGSAGAVGRASGSPSGVASGTSSGAVPSTASGGASGEAPDNATEHAAGRASGTATPVDIRWHPEPADAAALLRALQHAFEPYLAAVMLGDAAGATAAFDTCRVLTATRSGARGVQRLNEQLDAWARGRLEHGAATTSPWYAGRPVTMWRNQPALKLANGDTGIAWRGADGALGVRVPGHALALAPARIAEVQSAWVSTVHKAQGSEFDEVLLLLPEPPHPLLTRELLYTAITRARRRLVLFASPAALAAAIATPTRRFSGLGDRLRVEG